MEFSAVVAQTSFRGETSEGGVRNVGCFLSLKTDEDSTSLVMAFSARVIKEVYIFQGSAINAAAFHPDGRSIALGFKKGG